MTVVCVCLVWFHSITFLPRLSILWGDTFNLKRSVLHNSPLYSTRFREPVICFQDRYCSHRRKSFLSRAGSTVFLISPGCCDHTTPGGSPLSRGCWATWPSYVPRTRDQNGHGRVPWTWSRRVYIRSAHLTIYMLIHWDGTRRLHLGISPETGVSGPHRQAILCLYVSLSHLIRVTCPVDRLLSPCTYKPAVYTLTVHLHTAQGPLTHVQVHAYLFRPVDRSTFSVGPRWLGTSSSLARVNNVKEDAINSLGDETAPGSARWAPGFFSSRDW